MESATHVYEPPVDDRESERLHDHLPSYPWHAGPLNPTQKRVQHDFYFIFQISPKAFNPVATDYKSEAMRTTTNAFPSM